MQDIVRRWNEFAQMKVRTIPEEIVIQQEMHRLSDVGITKESILKGIENYREALSLPNSMANQHPIGRFLRQYFRESYIDGMYDPKRYSKNGYVKPQSVKTEKTYVLPRPDHVSSLEERRAIKEEMMAADAKTKSLFQRPSCSPVKVDPESAGFFQKYHLASAGKEIGHIAQSNKMVTLDVTELPLKSDHISQADKMVEPVGVNNAPTEHRPTQAENKAKLGQFIIDIMKFRESKGGKAYTPQIEVEPIKGDISTIFRK